jgi:hypothetical protein
VSSVPHFPAVQLLMVGGLKLEIDFPAIVIPPPEDALV